MVKRMSFRNIVLPTEGILEQMDCNILKVLDHYIEPKAVIEYVIDNFIDLYLNEGKVDFTYIFFLKESILVDMLEPAVSDIDNLDLVSQICQSVNSVVESTARVMINSFNQNNQLRKELTGCRDITRKRWLGNDAVLNFTIPAIRS